MKKSEQRIIATVDIVLLTLWDSTLQVLLLQREHEPFAQRLALPGGYIYPQEDRDSLAAAQRVLQQKTGLTPPYLEQLYTFANAKRDPRGWSASVSYYALVDHEALHLEKNPLLCTRAVDSLPELPFDHSRIVDTAVKRLRDKSSYSALPCHLLPELFTLSELQKTYEQILGTSLDKSAFRRRIAEHDFLEKTNHMRRGGHRPARLYRIRQDEDLALFDRTI